MAETPEHLTVAQTASRLDRSTRYVRMLCENGTLAATKYGRQWRITPDSVDAYLLPQAAPGTRIDTKLDAGINSELDAVLTDATNPRVLLAQLDSADTEIAMLRERLADKDTQIEVLRNELHHHAAAITELVAKNFAPKPSGQ